MASRQSRLCVRPAAITDAGAIGETHGAAWEAAYTHIFDPSFLGAAVQGRRIGWRYSIEHLVAPPNVLLVGEADGEVRAFAHARPCDDTPGIAEIRGFFAHPDVWGRGLAVLLMERLCQILVEHGYDKAVLWTPREAHRARGFYEKVGFDFTMNTRIDRVTDWTTGASAELPEVEYAKRLK